MANILKYKSVRTDHGIVKKKRHGLWKKMKKGLRRNLRRQLKKVDDETGGVISGTNWI